MKTNNLKGVNATLASAVILAITSSAQAGIEIDNFEDMPKDNLEKAQEINAIIKTPIVSAMIGHNFDDLVKVIREEGVSLVDVYASVSTGGSTGVLQSNFSDGFSNSNNVGTTFTASSTTTGTCHQPPCHVDCHSNHSSRGWR